MVSGAWQSFSLKWCFFFIISSQISYEEYSQLYYQQLGFSAGDIGLSSLIGVASLLLVPVVGMIGDRFRARKLLLLLSVMGLILLTLAPLLPLVVNRLRKCTGVMSSTTLINRTSDSNESFLSSLPAGKNRLESHQMTNVSRKNAYRSSLLPSLFLYVVVIRGAYSFLEWTILSLLNVAVMTYVKDQRESYGSYLLWDQLGSSLFLLSIGILASQIQFEICGNVGHGYFVTFIFTAITLTLALLAFPWIQYEYLDHRVINWTEVKGFFSECHYLVILVLSFYFAGSLYTFQLRWEFWYIAKLSGSPTLMGTGGAMRRPLAAIWLWLSVKVITRLGDLKTMTVALALYSVSMMSLSFINIPWLVIVIDVFQSAAMALAYSSLTIHFSKATSNASSALILGVSEMVYAMGITIGNSFMGLLFHSIGSKATLFYYSITTAIIAVLFTAYIYGGKNVENYERASNNDSDSDCE